MVGCGWVVGTLLTASMSTACAQGLQLPVCFSRLTWTLRRKAGKKVCIGMSNPKPYKIPQSVLVVIHTPMLDVLLIRRIGGENHWQSVTGSKDTLEESFEEAARREVTEETGIDTHAPGCLLTDWALENVYDIWPQWLPRYAPGVVRNRERVFGLCVPLGTPVVLSPHEHDALEWLPRVRAAERCFSASNAEACLLLPRFTSP